MSKNRRVTSRTDIRKTLGPRSRSVECLTKFCTREVSATSSVKKENAAYEFWAEAASSANLFPAFREHVGSTVAEV